MPQRAWHRLPVTAGQLDYPGRRYREVGAVKHPEPDRPRKPYNRPRLHRYGAISELTRFGGSSVLDSGGNFGLGSGSGQRSGQPGPARRQYQ